VTRREAVFSIVILLSIVWFGNFYEFDRFTLYADDWAFLGRAFSNPYTFMGWVHSIVPYADGRPIQSGLIVLTANIIEATGGLDAAYLFMFLLTFLSVVAVWWALTYRFSNEAAVLAASVFALSPLVSIRPFLNDIASPAAFLFLMIAGVLYISGWRVLSYFVAALCLLSYEMVFPLFAPLPALLRPLRTRRDLFGLIGHFVICAAIVSAYALFRDRFGTSRLSGTIAGHSMFEIGSGVVGAIAPSAENGGLGSIDLPLWMQRIAAAPVALLWGTAAFAGFAVFLNREGTSGGAVGREAVRQMAQTLAILVFLMIPAGYALTYFGAPDGAEGVFDRRSRFHGAAVLPFAILTSLMLIGLLRAVPRGWWRRAVLVAEAGFLALLFAFSVSHQEEFAAAAKRQRLLVAQLARDHPMMDPQATFILRFPFLDSRHLPSIEYEDSHSFYFLLRDLFDFGGGTGQRVGPSIRIVHGDGWERQLTLGSGGELDWASGIWPSEPEHVGHVWYYEFALDGVLRPLPAPILVGGRNILHEGPDLAEGAVDLGRVKHLPYFALLMGRDAALVEAADRGGGTGPAVPEAPPPVPSAPAPRAENRISGRANLKPGAIARRTRRTAACRAGG
jgi:hypothetical protein